MKMNIKYLFLLSLLLIIMSTSCSTQKDVIAFKMYSQKDKKIMKVNRSGIVSVSGKKHGILRPDGVLTNLEGDTLAYRALDGIVYSREHKLMGSIDEHGAIELNQDKKFAWTADGKLQVRENETIRVEPNFKEYYDKASFLFIIYATMASAKEAVEKE